MDYREWMREEETPRATCPVCGQPTIRLHFVDDLIGDAPMTGWITELDDFTQECGCTLTEEQSEEIFAAATH